jgi:hypothetical protein
MKDIVIEVESGAVVGLYCDLTNVRFVVVDLDSIESGDVECGSGIEPHEKLESIPSSIRKYYRRAISTKAHGN